VITREEIEAHRAECAERVGKTPLKGPWTTEPHRVEFVHAGLQCLLVRQCEMLHWCGYVGVPPTHPYFGSNYDDVPVEVHGGLTYAAACTSPVCHIPAEPGPDALWWFGFDCAHADDLSPGRLLLWQELKDKGTELSKGFIGGTYRDSQWVIGQTRKLADQLSRRR
jgi:hypothetical protein